MMDFEKKELSFEEYGYEERDTASILKRQIKANPNKPCFIFKNQIITYKDLEEITNRVANGFQRIGVQRNENVAVFLHNCLEFPFTWIALNKIGAIEYPLNTLYSGYLLEYYLNYSDARYLVIGEQFIELIQKIQDKLSKLEHLITIPGPKGEAAKIVETRFKITPFKELLSNPATSPGVKLSYSDVSVIMNTGGTTGPAKGVILSYNRQYTGSRNLTLHMGWGLEDRYYMFYPFYHNLAHEMVCLNAFIHGASVVIVEGFSARTFWEEILKYDCSAFYLTGTVMQILLKQPASPRDKQHRVRAIISYPRPPELTEQFEQRFNTVLLELYGATESNMNTILPFHDRRMGSCGVAHPDNEVFVIDEHDKELPVGGVGEIAIRPREPYFLCSGYYKMPEATAKALRNCLWHTGDFGRKDEDGFLYFVDRSKDAIRKSGERIASLDIETIANTYPNIYECAVIGIPSGMTEDEIMLVIQPKKEAELRPEEIVKYLDDRLPYFMVPRYVRFVESIPKSEVQRIQKFVLREEGITKDTWDRIQAGCKLKREIDRELKKK